MIIVVNAKVAKKDFALIIIKYFLAVKNNELPINENNKRKTGAIPLNYSPDEIYLKKATLIFLT
jgi:hypothetical protein